LHFSTDGFAKHIPVWFCLIHPLPPLINFQISYYLSAIHNSILLIYPCSAEPVLHGQI